MTVDYSDAADPEQYDIGRLSEIPYRNIAWALGHADLTLADLFDQIALELNAEIESIEAMLPYVFNTQYSDMRTQFTLQRDRLQTALRELEPHLITTEEGQTHAREQQQGSRTE